MIEPMKLIKNIMKRFGYMPISEYKELMQKALENKRYDMLSTFERQEITVPELKALLKLLTPASSQVEHVNTQVKLAEALCAAMPEGEHRDDLTKDIIELREAAARAKDSLGLLVSLESKVRPLVELVSDVDKDI